MLFFFCALWFYKPPRNTEVDIDVKRDNSKETATEEQNETFENENKCDTVHSNNAFENDTNTNLDEKNLSLKNEDNQNTVHPNNVDPVISYNKQDTQTKAPTDHVNSQESTHF